MKHPVKGKHIAPMEGVSSMEGIEIELFIHFIN